MKKAVLILFVISIVFCQQEHLGNKIVIQQENYNPMSSQWNYEQSKPLAFQDDWKVEILKAYESYKTECYNDSTFCGDLTVRYYIPEYKLWADSIKTNYYQHELPTLDGFMEYLKGEKAK
jgi:hypothetical protein